MRGKLRAKHYVRPAHVKAGFKCINRRCIDNRSGRLFQSFSIFEWWNISFSLAYSCVLSWSSPPLLQAEPRLYTGAIPCQSLKNLTIFNFAQVLHANSHPQEKQLCQIKKNRSSIFRVTPSQKWKFYPGNRAWPPCRINLLSITLVIIKLGPWLIHFWKDLIKHNPLDLQSVNYK